MEPKLRGSLAHNILEKVYQRLLDKYFSKNDVPTLAILEDYLEDAVQIVLKSEWENSTQASMLPRRVLEDEVRRIKEQAWRVLKSDYDSWTSSPSPLFPRFLEWRFGKSGTPVVFYEINENLGVSFSGAIDRIDVNEKTGDFLVIDYKSSGTEAFAKLLREKKSFQLFIYLYALQNSILPHSKAIGALYYDLKDGKRNQGMAVKSDLSLYTTQPLRSLSFFNRDQFEKLSAELDQALKELLTKLLSGDYSLNPPDCQGARCPYHTICRYEEQPD
jgi:ATP-dependent helicase/DNAse subunit B